MGWLVSAGVAVAGSLPLLASAANPGAHDEAKQVDLRWAEALRSDSVGDFATVRFARTDVESASATAFRVPDVTTKYIAVPDKNGSGSVVTSHPSGASITFSFDDQHQVQSGAKARTVDAAELVIDRLFVDATEFGKHLKNLRWKPSVWSDESEVVFEWISGDRHAVVSIEGDGAIGYTMLRDGIFVSGEVEDPPVSIMPPDLREYLSVA